MIIAGMNELSFEPKMPADLDATGETETPEGMRPVLGPLVSLRYKPTTWRYNVRLSEAPTTGTVKLELRADTEVLKSVTLDINGVTHINGQTKVSTAAVAGETPLSVVLVVDAAADDGITAEVDSVLACEIPVTTSGGC